MRHIQVTLVDLLDRVLEKGLVIQADLIVSVAGIPLIGVNLRAAIAGMETMVKYGVMRDWDEAIRARSTEAIRKQQPALEAGEEIITSMLGSKYCTQGIYTAWRPGRVFLTDRRLILYLKAFEETVFEAPIEKIEGIALCNGQNPLGVVGDEVQMVLKDGELVRIRAESTGDLLEGIKSIARNLGLDLDDEIINEASLPELFFLEDEEELLCTGKMWLLARPESTQGTVGQLWRPGNLYLTSGRLVWVSGFESQKYFEVRLDRISGVTLEHRRPSEISKEQMVIDLVYLDGEGKEVASLAGADAQVRQWHRVLEMATEGKLPETFGQELESCPACEHRNFTEKLLSQGCPYCGWVSPRAVRLEVRPQKA